MIGLKIRQTSCLEIGNGCDVHALEANTQTEVQYMLHLLLLAFSSFNHSPEVPLRFTSDCNTNVI